MPLPRPLSTLVLAGSAALTVSCSVFGIRTTEEAPYRVLEQDGDFELREYAALVVAETTVAGDLDESQNAAFFRLFDYIQGDNQAAQEIAMTAPVLQERAAPRSEKIAMTAPVFQEQGEAGWKMSFVLPEGYTLESAPRPTHQQVTLRRRPPVQVAAVRYSGSRGAEDIREQTVRLRSWMETRELRSAGDPRAAGYDPPFTLPFLRRNEVLIDVLSQF